MLGQAQASLKGILNFISTNIQFGFGASNQEAIEYFESKGLKPTFDYLAMQQEEHNKAFTVAKMLDMDLLQEVHGSLTEALKNEWTYQEWSDRIVPILQSKGWWGRQEIKDPITGKTIIAQLGSPHRLKTIFRTNMQQAYMVGRWQQIMETAKERPYLRYDAIDDQRTRPKHRAWNALILPFNHPFWRKHYPPNGYNCRCSVTQFSKADLEENGYKISQNPDLSTDGIEVGFDNNAGLSYWSHLQDIASQKAQSIQDQGLRKAAQEALDNIQLAKEKNKFNQNQIRGASVEQDKHRQVSTGGLRNEEPLSVEQIEIAIDYAVRLGVPKDAIHISEAMNTSYKVVFGIETLYIGTDVLPALTGDKANSKIGMLAALAHEIVGHRQAEIAGKTNSVDVLEEAQASIRAARHAPDLLLTERILLLRDAIERLQSSGLKIRDVKHRLWLDKYEDN